jgi:hypothetical protein
VENKVIIALDAKKTSRDAAENALPRSGTIRWNVYQYILGAGIAGATDQEVEQHLHIDGNTVRPSRKLLEKEGLIIDSGITRKNKKGNDCIVWKAVEINGVQLNLL